jgi:hypothetical protein
MYLSAGVIAGYDDGLDTRKYYSNEYEQSIGTALHFDLLEFSSEQLEQSFLSSSRK